MRHALLAAALILPALSTPSLAQSHPLVGKWEVEYAGGMRMENGTPTPLQVKATMTVTETADSLIVAVVVATNPELGPRPPFRLAAAKPVGTPATFLQTSQATINANGEERAATSITTWKLQADGSTLTGTLARRLEGFDMPPMPESPVKGTKVN